MKPIVIIGPTASGKTGAALEVAAATGGRILSLDSLSIYKEIDIASAKPTPEERGEIVHYGIDVLFPDQYFSAAVFADLYREAEAACREANVPLIIVGGSSFYLKTLIDGMSHRPDLSESTQTEVGRAISDLDGAYRRLKALDPETMAKIEPNDRYRIGNMLGLYLETGEIPSVWFRNHPPRPLLDTYSLYEIDVSRPLLRERIGARTAQMFAAGLIDEVTALERRYGRAPNPMKAIGIIEVLEYLDGKTDRAGMIEAVNTHTAQLAKRQQTFNRNQFHEKTLLPLDALRELLLRDAAENLFL